MEDEHAAGARGALRLARLLDQLWFAREPRLETRATSGHGEHPKAGIRQPDAVFAVVEFVQNAHVEFTVLQRFHLRLELEEHGAPVRASDWTPLRLFVLEPLVAVQCLVMRQVVVFAVDRNACFFRAKIKIS